MLNDYLLSKTQTKFILIEDSLHEKGDPLIKLLIDHHLNLGNSINYYVFEGNYQKQFKAYSVKNVNCHNFCSKSSKESLISFEKQLKSEQRKNNVVIIDSIIQLIHMFGLIKTYELLNNFMRTMKENQQIITTLHTDLCENSEQLCQYLENLATLHLAFEPESSRVLYTYKKVGGKIFRDIEQYKFEGNKFTTEPLKKPDINELVKDALNQVSPETLTTFKIGLSESEKESREKLVLPYLPKEKTEDNSEADGQIFYKFDHVDDWDEEDPDDDLDI